MTDFAALEHVVDAVGPSKAQVVDHLCTMDFVMLTKSCATQTICSSVIIPLHQIKTCSLKSATVLKL